MKNFTFLFVLGFLLALSLNSFSQINVNSSGDVGINNTSPSYQLDVSGDFRVSASGEEIVFEDGIFAPSYLSCCNLGDYSAMWMELYASDPYFDYSPTILSDINNKTDITDLSDSKSKVMVLRPVSYKLDLSSNDEEISEAAAEKAETEQFGLIAQDVIEIYPEIITEREDGTLGIRYTELIPVLIKAMQEQQDEIDALTERIESLESNQK